MCFILQLTNRWIKLKLLTKVFGIQCILYKCYKNNNVRYYFNYIFLKNHSNNIFSFNRFKQLHIFTKLKHQNLYKTLFNINYNVSKFIIIKILILIRNLWKLENDGKLCHPLWDFFFNLMLFIVILDKHVTYWYHILYQSGEVCEIAWHFSKVHI